jgi:hypothetical protein
MRKGQRNQLVARLRAVRATVALVPEYQHSHIVPAGYLRAWAKEGTVGVEWKRREGAPSRLAPKSLGVRRGFYREQLADRTFENWLEPAMSNVEAPALAAAREIEKLWPLEPVDRARLSEYMALQMARSPRWRTWYEQIVGGAPSDRTLWQSDSVRQGMVVQVTRRFATVLANMHWTLLRCDEPQFATSDHPFVTFNAGPGAMQPADPAAVGGVFAVWEYRLALSPRLLLVMTWQDEFGPEPMRAADIEQVRNHNGVVIAQAEQQWFHYPGEIVQRAPGPWPALALDFFAHGYQPNSRRRATIKDTVAKLIRDPSERGIKVIQWRGAASTSPDAT